MKNLALMFTPGRIVFVFVFLLIFIIGMFWAYRKDIQKSPWYFKGSMRIILILTGIYVVYFVLVRYIL